MRICDVGGGIGLLKILFAWLLWEGGIRCNDFLIIGQCFALQQRLTLAREPRGLVQDERFVIVYNYCENDKVQCKIAI